MNDSRCLHIAILALFLGLPSLAIAGDEQSGSENPCSSPEHRHFDFWIGDWTVILPDGTVAGHNRIERIMNGCALQENWTGARGTVGTSLNIYSASDGLWRQTWIDTGGNLLELKGGVRNGSMVMSGDAVGRDGKTLTHRITWTPREDGTVKQVWDASKDRGKTWNSVFDGTYTRSK